MQNIKYGGRNEFRKKLAGLGHERRWVGAKDAHSGRVGAHSTNIRPTFEYIDGRLVVCIYNRGGNHSSQNLGD